MSVLTADEQALNFQPQTGGLKSPFDRSLTIPSTGETIMFNIGNNQAFSSEDGALELTSSDRGTLNQLLAVEAGLPVTQTAVNAVPEGVAGPEDTFEAQLFREPTSFEANNAIVDDEPENDTFMADLGGSQFNTIDPINIGTVAKKASPTKFPIMSILVLVVLAAWAL